MRNVTCAVQELACNLHAEKRSHENWLFLEQRNEGLYTYLILSSGVKMA